MRIGIFAREGDPIAAHTAIVARDRGHEAVRIGLTELVSGAPMAWGGGSWTWQGHDLMAFDGFVVRQFPAPYAMLGPEDETATSADWYRRSVMQAERSSVAVSALMDLEAWGKPLVNPLLASQPYDHKPLQLAAFRRAGLPIPETLITNWPEAVRIFEQDVGSRGGALVTKPSAGGAETLLVDDAVRSRLSAIATTPAIFQERIQGPDIRVTVVGDRVVSSVAIASDTLDYRSGAAYREGGARYDMHPLSENATEMCLRAARTCHHVLSGIDLKERGPNDYVILEANSAPMYLDIEEKTGAPITRAVIEHLERVNGR